MRADPGRDLPGLDGLAGKRPGRSLGDLAGQVVAVGRDGAQEQRSLQAPAANVFVDDVGGDRSDPAVEGALPAVAGDRLDQLDEGDLDQIGAVLIEAAEETAHGAGDDGADAQVEGVGHGGIAAAQPGEDLIVGETTRVGLPARGRNHPEEGAGFALP